MNFTLTIPHNVIPYIKEFKTFAGTVNGCLLFQQLNYWFGKKPDSFYKFQSPPQQPHRKYRVGDSWTEELGISKDEFRAAFDRIGLRYFSKSDYDAAPHKFKRNGKEHFFCSYHDKIKNLTFYFRNDELVTSTLKDLGLIESVEAVEPVPAQIPLQNSPELLPKPEMDNPDFGKLENPIYSKLENPIPNSTEITNRDYSKNNNTAPQPLPEIKLTLEPTVVVELKKVFSDAELPAAKKHIAAISFAEQLAVIAEMLLKIKKPNNPIPNKIGYLRGIISNVKNGTFTPTPAAAKPLTLTEIMQKEKIKEEEAKKRCKVDNVAFFADMYKKMKGNFEIPEPFKQAVFERLACCG